MSEKPKNYRLDYDFELLVDKAVEILKNEGILGREAILALELYILQQQFFETLKNTKPKNTFRNLEYSKMNRIEAKWEDKSLFDKAVFILVNIAFKLAEKDVDSQNRMTLQQEETYTILGRLVYDMAVVNYDETLSSKGFR